MTREEFTLLVKGMKSIYSYDNFLRDQYSVDMWYSLLADLDYKVAAASLKNFMQTSTKVPTPADIRNGAFQLTTKPGMSDAQAWAMVSKAISNSGYNSRQEFDKLPETIRRAVGSARQLEVWSQTDIQSVETVIQSQFLRSYRSECTRSEQAAKMSPDIMQLANQTVERLEG